MATLVRIPSPLRRLAGGLDELVVDGGSVRELFENLEARAHGIRERVMDESGHIRHVVAVFVNEDDVRTLDGEDSRLTDGDVVSIVPICSGC